MKEDILEQLAEDYLQAQGYFTRHNLKFKPRPDHPAFDSKLDSNHSDIDVIGIHPGRSGAERVWVVSCKSWQTGFDVQAKLAEISENKIRSGRESWKGFRELADAKWAEAFCQAVRDATGQGEFTYFTAVTKIRGDRTLWENHAPFKVNLCQNPVRLLSFSEMASFFSDKLTTTIVPSQLGRTLQLVRASGGTLTWPA